MVKTITIANQKEIEAKLDLEGSKQLAQASTFAGGMPSFGDSGYGSFFLPNGDVNAAAGLTPEKLIVPKRYHSVLRMCYDFYQRGGIMATVINRLSEFTVTEIRNGQRKTTNEAVAYYNAILHSKPSRMMRFLRTMALEYYLSGLVLPRIDWVQVEGWRISPDLKPKKLYFMPVFDTYPPMLTEIDWAGWGQKTYWLKIPTSDLRLLRQGGSRVKYQQARYQAWIENYPSFVDMVAQGADRIQIEDSDPILRKEISITPYPTPYLFPVLEPLIYRQQLRRMDFAVASRVINAILLVQEGDKDFPVTAENSAALDNLKTQIQARQGDARMMERVFILFSNHTTKLTWVHPDVSAMLNQEKYQQVNDELLQGVGFAQTLLTGESRQIVSEISTYAVQPQMEEFRSMAEEWVNGVYYQAGELNSFKDIPVPHFRPIRLQDFIKTAAIFAQAFKEGNISRTTRAESVGTDFETETELMKDEGSLMAGLPAYQATPYSPLPPIIGPNGNISDPGQQNPGGRPQGSQNVPVNNRNSGVKPSGQQPKSRIKAGLWSDEQLVEALDDYALKMGITINPDDVLNQD